MEDKTFDLLTKMYNEFSGRFDGVEKDIKDIKSDVTGLKNDVTGLKNDAIRFENKLDNTTKALFDGYKQTYEEIKEIRKTMAL